MRKTILILTAASIVLAACGFRDSRVNPRNWFGASRERAIEARAQRAQTETKTVEVNPLLPARTRSIAAPPEVRDLSVEVEQVTELRVEPTATGAIIYASGIATRQGAFGARLTPANDSAEPDENGVLSLSFRVVYPRYATLKGTDFSRTVHDAFSLTNVQLQRVRVIRVTAAQNARETRRR